MQKGIALACPDSKEESSDEYELPAVEAVLAGTLALMTGFAEADRPAQRGRMMDKVIGNLELLAGHPQLSMEFRCAVGRLRRHWEHLSQHDGDAGALAVRHPAPGVLQ
jgi:hypothetical protein